MTSRLLCLAVSLSLAAVAFAQNEIQRGEFKSVDLDRKQITLTVRDKEVTYAIDEKTRVFGAEEKKFSDRYAGLKPGMEVMFKPNSKDVLVGRTSQIPQAVTA